MIHLHKLLKKFDRLIRTKDPNNLEKIKEVAQEIVDAIDKLFPKFGPKSNITTALNTIHYHARVTIRYINGNYFDFDTAIRNILPYNEALIKDIGKELKIEFEELEK